MASLEYNATVAGRVEIAPGYMILRVVPDQLPFTFQAGQYTVLGLKASAASVTGKPRRAGCSLAAGAAPEAESLDGVACIAPSPDGSADGVIDAPREIVAPGTAETGRVPAAAAAPDAAPTESPDPDKLIRRAYSVASSSRAEEFIEFYLGLVPSGELTPRLFALQPGHRLFLGPKATGMFTLGRVPKDKHVILVATGTGLAPYMSMLRSDIECGGPQKVAVLHGARCSWDLAYRTELMSLSAMCPNITYLPVVALKCDDPEWGGLTGYLQDVLFSGEVERRTPIPLDPAETHVFLCGHPKMIEAARDRLVAERGYTLDQRKEMGTLHLEEYW
jgi:ferredoxin/flavodoxin---NADP+ reductase